MNWLARFQPKKVPSAKPGAEFDSAATNSMVAFDGTILHDQWQRRGGAGDIIEHAFVNPDPASPIAAIVVSGFLGDGGHNTLMIDVIDNVAISPDARKAKLSPDKLQGGMYCGVAAETKKGLLSLGVTAPSYSHTILADISGEDMKDEGSRNYMVKRIAEIMDAFSKSSALSTNPAVRDAMVRTIRETFVSLRPLESTPAQIEGPHA